MGAVWSIAPPFLHPPPNSPQKLFYPPPLKFLVLFPLPPTTPPPQYFINPPEKFFFCGHPFFFFIRPKFLLLLFQCYYLHTPKDLMSHICGIFIEEKKLATLGWLITYSQRNKIIQMWVLVWEGGGLSPCSNLLHLGRVLAYVGLHTKLFSIKITYHTTVYSPILQDGQNSSYLGTVRI